MCIDTLIDGHAAQTCGRSAWRRTALVVRTSHCSVGRSTKPPAKQRYVIERLYAPGGGLRPAAILSARDSGVVPSTAEYPTSHLTVHDEPDERPVWGHACRHACVHVCGHDYRHVRRHMCTHLCTHMCVDMSLDMYVDMCHRHCRVTVASYPLCSHYHSPRSLYQSLPQPQVTISSLLLAVGRYCQSPDIHPSMPQPIAAYRRQPCIRSSLRR